MEEKCNARNERQISDGRPVTCQPSLLGENGVEHTEDTVDLVLVPLDGARQMIGVGEGEPCELPVVRALTGALEKEPLQQRVLVIALCV